MLVLGIESSCDETGVALYDERKGLLAHCLHSQIKMHQKHGGVVPELASRDHIKRLALLVDSALSKAGIIRSQIDAIAYTAGPGLIGALLTGACFAKSLALGLKIPALAVHHLEAHILAAQLETPSLQFPFVALLVSGGHTQLIEAKSLGEYVLLGDTLDDAVGEAFDKTAKLMGIDYPGGAELARLADNASFDEMQANAMAPFPRPMLDRAGLDFSFSGLKTHAVYAWKKSTKDMLAKQRVARAFQDAVVETLFKKCQRALAQTGHSQLVVAGGVGANRALRGVLQAWGAKAGKQLYFPSIAFCTDNGAMVAYAGCLHLLRGERDKDWSTIVKPRWPF